MFPSVYLQSPTPSGSLQSQAYEILKERILSDQLEHGVIYSLTKVAKELGISRTPIKDAVTRLSDEKYIDIFPSKGFALHTLTEADISNTYQTRTAYECYAAYDLTSSDSDRAKECVQKLKNFASMMEQAIEQHAPLKQLSEYDSAFHSTLVLYLNNSEISTLYDSYTYRLRTIAIRTFEEPNRPMIAVQEHQRIIEAIESGSCIDAYEAVRSHLDITNNLAKKCYSVEFTADQAGQASCQPK